MADKIMTTYERVILKGIPFLMDSTRHIYTYEIGPTVPIQIGTLDKDRNLVLFSEWESRVAERVTTWRSAVTPTERGKIREQFKPVKQSRARKNNRKPTTTA